MTDHHEVKHLLSLTEHSCKFRRQIKCFEKVLSLSKALQLSGQQQPPADEQEDKPTFFFGDFARLQLVDPILGDGHFLNVSRSIKKLIAPKQEKSEACSNRVSSSINSSFDKILVSQNSKSHAKKRLQRPSETNSEHVEDLSLIETAHPAMQMMTP